MALSKDNGSDLGGVIFFFNPIWGRFPILTNIFQMLLQSRLISGRNPLYIQVGGMLQFALMISFTDHCKTFAEVFHKETDN